MVAEKPPIAPIMFKAILESWCHLNCVGSWDAQLLTDTTIQRVSLDLHSDDDIVLFMLSPEYTYMGRPPLNP